MVRVVSGAMGRLRFNELAEYTKRRVSEAAMAEWNRSQEPILTGSEGDRVLIQIP